MCSSVCEHNEVWALYRIALKKTGHFPAVTGSGSRGPAGGGAGSDAPGDLKLFGTVRLVFAILLRETVQQSVARTARPADQVRGHFTRRAAV